MINEKGYTHCPSLFNLIFVLLISFPIPFANLENSPLLPAVLAWINRCFASEVEFLRADRFFIESTHVLNSVVRSWTDIR